MKKFTFLFPLIFFGCISFSIAQNKVDKYCQVLVTNKGFVKNLKQIMKISFGDDKGLFSFKDSIVMQQLRTVDHFTSATDVLNYMSRIGWTLVNVHYPVTYGTEILYFKKAFDSSELAE